jgi:aldose 1-epimerase
MAPGPPTHRRRLAILASQLPRFAPTSSAVVPSLSGSPRQAATGGSQSLRASRTSWGEVGGSAVELVTLRNAAGVEASILTYGCVLQSVLLPVAGGGENVDVVLGYDTLGEYVNGKSNFGSIVGRYANRIPDGRFSVQGKEYLLPPNAGPTALHGGAEGLYTRVFTTSSLSETADSATAEFTYTSPANEAGYPGELSVTFICSLNDANELRMEYGATTSEPTIVSLTNHSYWNLNGHGGNSIMDQELALHCSTYTPTDPNNQSVPTGELAPVDGTEFDFRPGNAGGGGVPGVTIGSRTRDLEMKALGTHCWLLATCIRLADSPDEIFRLYRG